MLYQGFSLSKSGHSGKKKHKKAHIAGQEGMYESEFKAREVPKVNSTSKVHGKFSSDITSILQSINGPLRRDLKIAKIWLAGGGKSGSEDK